MTTKAGPIQLSIHLSSFSAEDPKGWSHLFNDAKLADSAGVDRIVVSDHVVFGERLEEYGKAELGGSTGGSQPTGPDGHWLEPLTTLSVLAGMTSRVRLGTNVILAALRRPVVLAKSVTTLDVLSGGRLDLGVGVGWQKEEYDAAGLPFDGRGHLLNHTLEVMQTLWTQNRASFDSPLLKFDNIHMMPKPLQAGGVPIWVSGTIRSSTVKRLAQFGSGWIPWGPDAANLTESLPRMKNELERIGKNTEKLQVVGYLPIATQGAGEINIEATMERLAPLTKVGVTDFRTTLDALCANRDPEKLHRIVDAFRDAVGRKS
jgi:probable F420-dependent oxidoreductase